MEPIAIVGLSLKFPQDATSLGNFWKMLVERRCAMTDFPPTRLNVDAFYHPDISQGNTLPLRGGHFIQEDLSAFDAGFFSIVPTEATAMDPAQRGLLETAYRAFENAGISLDEASGSNTSVHTGCFTDDYKLQILKDPEQIPKYAATGASLAMLANRLSWFFNLAGPSMNIDSACSSSGIAIDHGCQLLRNRDCDMSIVAGCNITFVSDYTSILTKMGFLSPDSRCYTFDHRANGYARGEGIGVLILKRLSDALRNRNTIRAIIRSSGSNQDARTPGITQPSSQAEERLIRETYRKAGLSMEYTRFVEAHGTGTKIGDTIETAAIGNAFRSHRSQKDPLYVGAVKTNIGHLEGASGLAGLMKAILVLETGVIAPNTNYESTNERIDTEYLNLSLPLTCVPWPTTGLRRISVNSFGFGGSNSHVVLDDAFNHLRDHNLSGIHCTARLPPKDAGTGASSEISYDHHETFHGPASEGAIGAFQTPKLLVLSTSDKGELARMATLYQEHLSKVLEKEIDHDNYMNNLAYTLDTRRSRLQWRSHIVLGSLSSIYDLADRMSTPVTETAHPPRLGFVFTGQGAQWYAMGRELLHYPVYAESIESATIFLGSLGCTWSIRDELTRSETESNIDDSRYSQTICTALQVALVDLMDSIDIGPSAVIGHSSGEIAAAYCAGAISRESTWKIAFYRGQMVALVARRSSCCGAMISVGLSAHDIAPYLSKLESSKASFDTDISCFNSNKNVTVSGPDHQIDLLKIMLDEAGVFARKLRVPVAYHSKQMEHVTKEYSELLRGISSNTAKPAIPMVSSVRKLRVNPKELLQSDYWVRNMVSPVHFLGAMHSLCSANRTALTKKIDGSHRNAIFVDHLLEVGPHAALRGPIRDFLGHKRRRNEISYSSVLRRNESASNTFLELVGNLYGLGVPVDLRSINDPFIEFRNARITLVDLPEYSFDHSVSYWHESRFSSDYRLRDHGPVELLGSPSSDWNPLDAQWRNIVRASNIPWAEEHKISGAALCPGAGMIVMAIEAAFQVADLARHIIGYALRDIVFGVALDLSPSPTITETKFALRSLNNAPAQVHPWYSFSVYSLRNGIWTEHCTGSIQIQYELIGGPEDLRSQTSIESYQDLWESRKKDCNIPTDSSDFYKFLQHRSIEYGPAFRLLKHLYTSSNGSGEIVAEFSPLEIGRNPAARLRVIHPATLDAALHSVFAAQSRGATEEIDTQVPTGIQSMWISSEGLTGQPEESVLITTKIDTRNSLVTKCSSFALDKKRKHLRILIDGLEMSVVAKSTSISNSRPAENQIWSEMRLALDVDLLSNAQLGTWLNQDCSSPQPEPVAFFQDLRLFLMSILWNTRARMASNSWEISQTHFRNYLDWIDFHLDEKTRLCSQQVPIQNAKTLEHLDSRVRNYDPIGLLFSKVAQHLSSILEGRVDVLNLLFEDNLVEDFYAASSQSSMCFKKLQNFLGAVAVKRPNLRILEVGAGTGVFTRIVLEALSVRDGGELQATMCDHYEFTDVSPSFFEKARAQFSEHDRKMAFRIFDMEKIYSDKEHKEGSYDIVVAANVLHIARNLNDCLRSLRKLLKPGGKLLLHETTVPDDITTGFVFGLLQDWWLSCEPNRKMSPLLTEHEWHVLLKDTGFSGTDMVLRDFEDEACHQSTIMISTASNEPGDDAPSLPATRIVIDQSSHAQQVLAEGLQERLHKHHQCAASISSSREVSQQKCQGSLQIYLVEMYHPVLSELESAMFSSLKSSLQHVDQILWTTGGGGQSLQNPGFGMVDGFARALRLERNELRFVTLALDPDVVDLPSKLDHIIQAMCQSFVSPMANDYEREYIEISGALHLRRLEPAKCLKNCISKRLCGQQTTLQRLDASKPFELKVFSSAQNNHFQFAAKDSATPAEHDEEEIEIEVQAVGLSIGHSTRELGLLDGSSIGNECAGIVRRIPSRGSSRVQVGDRVCVLGTNLCQSHARAPQDLIAHIPDDMTFEQACALPFRSWVAYYLINEVAKLTPGESILIHGGGSPLGQLTILLAQEAKADIYITVHSEEDRCTLQEHFSLPDDHIFLMNSILSRPSPVDFKQSCTVALSICNATDYFNILQSLKPFGRYVHLTRNSDSSEIEGMPAGLPRNVSVHMVDPSSLAQAYSRHGQRPLQSIIDQVGRLLCGLQEIRSHSVSQIAEAVCQLKVMDQDARVVVRMHQDDMIPLTKAIKPEYSFDSTSSYLIAGGFGGVGRCVARWMVSRGARNLILLSRSGPRNPNAVEMVFEMKAQGVRLKTPRCDAADLVALRSILHECSKILPPVRGCIQASGAIEDVWFESMSFEQWTATTKPKVQASWNLHTVLPKGMDFFILTASISGIFGQNTQVNYASGNTYQDALARYRISEGEKAVSLDLGLLLIDGLLKDKPELVERLTSTGYFIPLSEAELIAIFEYYCNPGFQLSCPADAQPVVGIQSPAVLGAQGIELPQSMQEPLCSLMKCFDNCNTSAPEAKRNYEDLAAKVSNADSAAKAATIVTEAMMEKVAQFLSMSPEKLDADRPIHYYEVDSLTAVDIRNWISKTFEVSLSTFDILGNNTFNDMGLSIAKKCKQIQKD